VRAILVLLLIGLAAIAPAAWRQPAAPADLLIVGADIVTMEPALPRASAIAIRGGRIAALGSDRSLVSLQGPSTTVLDAGGRTILPGFVDSHLHLLEYGRSVTGHSTADLTLDQIEALVRREARAGRFLRIRGWGAYLPEGRRFPTSELLDTWAPDAPVVMERGDGHVALYNSAALRALDIERLMRLRNAPAGYLERDGSGRPTGILVEEANWAAMAEIERLTPDADRRVAVDAALARLRELGVTSVQNILFTPDVLGVYRDLLSRGELTVRIDAAIVGRQPRAEKEGILKSFGVSPDPDRLRINASKYFTDGAIGPATGALIEPYASDPANRGILQWKDGAELAAYFYDDLALGLQTMVHAMGDRAIRTALDAFDEVVRGRGPADYRFRIEHGNMPTPQDFLRWRRLGVVWSYQPPAWTDRYRAGRARALGEARLEYTENVEQFLAHAMPVAAGSDAPFYVDLNPLVNVANLAARHAHNTTFPRHVPVAQALRMVTIGAAFAAREEGSRGSLAPGKLADLILLSANPLDTAPDEIRTIRVERTIVGGRTVWTREGKSAGLP
jgi:predicted amidohydrolase YtcJ